jgi:2,3-bisphosphoglycerate-independent phosphoglycerate mutase
VNLELLQELAEPAETKILLLVIDGLGGLPDATGRSELEQARTPNLDSLARDSLCGMTVPVAHGVTPGSGPGHLALFGYDPEVHTVGRGVLEALGIDFDLKPADVAARGNFCTVNGNGEIIDRRAGRIKSEDSTKLVERLSRIQLPGVEAIVQPVKDHRFVLVLRGDGLSDDVTDTDPQREGVAPLLSRPLMPQADDTAQRINEWVDQAREILRDSATANMLTLRGIARTPPMPSLPEICKFRAAAIAAYPMYRGLAKLVGMDVIKTGTTFADELQALRENWNNYDFLFIHFKAADAAGEDGDFKAKVRALEEVDSYIEALRSLDADVFMVAGDHSTPAILGGHSWHPVPFALNAKKFQPTDSTRAFTESECRTGSLGTFPAKEALSLAMAHAGRLTKYGA